MSARLERCRPEVLINVFPLEGRGLVGWGQMGASWSSDLAPGDWVMRPRVLKMGASGPPEPDGMVVAMLSRLQEEAEDGCCVLVLWHQ